jgi:hypothetical protein
MDMASFISELIRAANETSKLHPTETARLLHRAAATIREYRKQIIYIPANDPGEGDIVFELTIMATSIDLFPPEKVSEMLVEATEVIKACKELLKEKR